MTCIVGVEYGNGGVIGADSATSSNGLIRKTSDSKIIKRTLETGERIYFGTSGSVRLAQLLEFSLELGRYNPDMQTPRAYLIQNVVPQIREVLSEGGHLKEKDERESIRGEGVILFQGRVFSYHSDLQIFNPQDNYAVAGSGSSVAVGSLFNTFYTNPVKSETDAEIAARTALQAASHHNAYVESPFDIIHQERNK